MEFRYSKQECSLAQCSTLEWLETNGIGGYASSTLLNCHTRKYHGLLVSKLAGMSDKYVLLSKLDDVLVVNDQEYPLSIHQYADCLLSDAFSSFQEFVCNTHPQIIYRIAANIYLAKEVLLQDGEDTVLIKYRVIGAPNAKLRLRPLLAYRNFHSLAKENSFLNAAITQVDAGGGIAHKITPYCDMPDFFITTALQHRSALVTPSAQLFIKEPVWYRNFAYPKEKERGYSFIEDLFSPCRIEFYLEERSEVIISCSLRNLFEQDALNLFQLWDAELRRRKEIERQLYQAQIGFQSCRQNEDCAASAPYQNTESMHITAMQEQLQKVARSFLRKNNLNLNKSCLQQVPAVCCAAGEECEPKEQRSISLNGEGYSSVIAGYHWFLEWGRDAMIALPGLTLCSAIPGLERECLAILCEFAAHEKVGLIPNFIGSIEETSAYNSVDASLWFAWAVQQYYAKTKDSVGVENYLWRTLVNIFTHYKNGTLYNIKMQDNGLLYAGNEKLNLTWMDAVVEGKPVTPRYGLAVEVNALWFNFLCFMHDLALTLTIEDAVKNEIDQLLPKIRLNFCQTFYDENLGYLYDFVNEKEKNSDLRPNQIFAISLPYSPLPKKIAQKIVQKVSEELLTPYGLRTLAPQDINYHGVYHGAQKERDVAYHNGTVWPWLLGHFGEALLKVYERKHVLEMLQPCLIALYEHMLHEAGIGTISEVFSGDMLNANRFSELKEIDPSSLEFPQESGKPKCDGYMSHHAGGCISQAWSVAEVLRLIYLLSQSGTI